MTRVFSVYVDLFDVIGDTKAVLALSFLISSMDDSTCIGSMRGAPPQIRQGTKKLEADGWVKRTGLYTYLIDVKRVLEVVVGRLPQNIPKPEPAKVEKKECVPGWVVAEAGEVYSQRTGGIPPAARIVKSFRQLSQMYDWQAILDGWEAYCHTNDPKYISPESFAAKAGIYVGQLLNMPKPTTDEEFFNAIGSGGPGRCGPDTGPDPRPVQ